MKGRRPGVKCPSCGHPFSTVSRTRGEQRTRKCSGCGRVFATRESAIGGTAPATDAAAVLKAIQAAISQTYPG